MLSILKSTLLTSMQKTNAWFEVENTGWSYDDTTGFCSWFTESVNRYDSRRWDTFDDAMAFAVERQQSQTDIKYRVVQVEFSRSNRQTVLTRTFTTVDEHLTIQLVGTIINT